MRGYRLLLEEQGLMRERAYNNAKVTGLRGDSG
jgi:hypothetical protein